MHKHFHFYSISFSINSVRNVNENACHRWLISESDVTEKNYRKNIIKKKKRNKRKVMKHKLPTHHSAMHFQFRAHHPSTHNALRACLRKNFHFLFRSLITQIMYVCVCCCLLLNVSFYLMEYWNMIEASSSVRCSSWTFFQWNQPLVKITTCIIRDHRMSHKCFITQFSEFN